MVAVIDALRSSLFEEMENNKSLTKPALSLLVNLKTNLSRLKIVIDKWFEDLSLYEFILHQISSSQMEDAFKEELKAIQQWFNVLSEQERTAALYSLVKSLNLDQIRFFMTVLQQMASKEMIGLGVSSNAVGPGGPTSTGGLQPVKSESPKSARKSKITILSQA